MSENVLSVIRGDQKELSEQSWKGLRNHFEDGELGAYLVVES